MYKDKSKQRSAAKERQKRYRAKQKGVTSEGVTGKALPPPVFLSNEDKGAINDASTKEVFESFIKPKNFGQPDCECRHCKNNRLTGVKAVLNHGDYKPAGELGKGEFNRVDKPGDVDYRGVVWK